MLRTDSGWLVLRAGSTVTVSWPGAEHLGAVEVYFEMAPTGTGMTPIIIGEDHNTADGVSIQWLVPQGLMGHLSARAASLGGRVLVDYTDNLVGVITEEGNPSSIQIISFSVNPNPVQRGGTLTLSWTTTGATSLSIVRYSERGNPINESWGKNLSANGSLAYTLPPQEYFNHIAFELRANPDQANMVSRRADVELICPFSTMLYFGCPMSQQTVNLIYQPFEGGHMIWRRDTRKIYALINGGTWHLFADTWVEGEPVYPSMPEDGSIPCPAMRPQRGLGKVWYNQLQPSIQPSIRDQLGCPTSAETSYDTLWEEHRGWMPDDTPAVIDVFRWPDGRRLVLDPSSGWALPPG